MAVNRVWFPEAPSGGGINKNKREQIAIGYSNLDTASPTTGGNHAGLGVGIGLHSTRNSIDEFYLYRRG